MGDQKNLILAIVISVAIIIVFQIFFPQQTIIVPDENIDISESPTTITSIDQVQTSAIEKIKTREEIISGYKNTFVHKFQKKYEFGIQNFPPFLVSCL